MERTITIIGGGVIGISLAYALIKANRKVVLIDKNDAIGHGASFANGAQLSYRYVSPLADKGVPLQGLKWLGQSDSPLNLHLRCSIEQWQWLIKFTLACNQKTNKINGANILRLSLLSQSILKDWRENDQLADFCWKKSGKMIIHRNQADFNKAASKIDPEFQRVLTPDEIIEQENSLKHIFADLKGAIYAPDDETADAYLYCVSLLNKLQQSNLFTLMTSTEVTKVNGIDRIHSITTTQGEIDVEEIVIASGNGVTQLLSPLDINLPIYPLKGYSLTLPFPAENGIVPKASVTDYGHKIVYAKLGDRLRVAAMVDIGYDDAIRPNRITALKNTIQSTFPKLQGLDDAEAWAGLRPSTPKGPPILGKTRYQNLWLNVGHGSLGFTLAAGSAAVLSAMLCQQESPIDLSGLSL